MSNKNYTTKKKRENSRATVGCTTPTSTPVVTSMVPLQNDKNIIWYGNRIWHQYTQILLITEANMNYYKDRQYSGQRKNNKKINNGQQNKTQKNINWSTQTPLILIPDVLAAPTVLMLNDMNIIWYERSSIYIFTIIEICKSSWSLKLSISLYHMSHIKSKLCNNKINPFCTITWPFCTI